MEGKTTAVAGTLVVNFEANTASFRAGVSRARADAKAFRQEVRALADQGVNKMTAAMTVSQSASEKWRTGMRALAAQTQQVTATTAQSTIHLGKLRGSLTGIAVAATGAGGGLGQFASIMLATFAGGGVAVIAAGLVAGLALAYNALTAATRKAREELEALNKTRLHEAKLRADPTADLRADLARQMAAVTAQRHALDQAAKQPFDLVVDRGGLVTRRSRLGEIQALTAALVPLEQAARETGKQLDDMLHGKGTAFVQSLVLENLTAGLKPEQARRMEVMANPDLDAGQRRNALLLLDAIAEKERAARIRDVIKGMREEIEVVGLTAGQLAAYRLKQLGATTADQRRAEALVALKELQEQILKVSSPGHNLGPLFDQTREGATAAEQAAALAAASAKGASLAMQGVGGQRGKSPLTEMLDAENAKLFEQTWKNAVRGIQGDLADFLGNMGDGFTNLVDFAKNAARTIQRIFAQLAAQAIIRAIFPAVFKGAGGGPTVGVDGGAPVQVDTAHTGGIVGQLSGTRTVPAMLFAGARRYHTGGLAGDEVPAILQRGERVVPKGHAVSAGSTLHIHNNVSFNVGFVDGADGEAWLRTRGGPAILSMVAQAAQDSPGFAAALRGNG